MKVEDEEPLVEEKIERLLKMNIFEVNALEDKEIWRQWKMKLKFEGEV